MNLDRDERIGIPTPALPHPRGAMSPQASRAALEDLILSNRISIVFQPIVDLATAEVAGYEALTRPNASSEFAHAGALFEAAESLQLYEEVEGIARREALRVAAEHRGSELLFLNNSPLVFTGLGFVDRIITELATNGEIPPQRVVLEITERTAHELIGGLGARAQELRDCGFGVALDDVGAGISGLNQIMELRPNWMKLDIELISRIDRDPLKQNLIRFFVHFARLGSMNLVAEGIERDEELQTLIELGVSHGQGFLIARPGEIGSRIDERVRRRIGDLHRQTEARRVREPATIRIDSLAEPVATCQLKELIGEIGERLATLLNQRGFAVQDGRRYVGWLNRAQIVSACASGRRDEEVRNLQIVDTPLVGADITLTEALEIVAALPEEQQTLPLIVQERGMVTGVATLRRLLLAVGEAQRRAPSHVAPLTGLPSRVQADRWISSRIRAADPCDIAFIDLRDFDAYNVTFGFESGDAMLVRLVGLIRSMLVEVPGGASFLAHLGEDRFMVAFPAHAHDRLEALSAAFDSLHAEFFTTRDLENGEYYCDDAAGRSRRYDLTRLRIVYLRSALQRVSDPRSLHHLAGRLRLRSHDPERGQAMRVITDDRAEAVAASRRASA